MSTSDELTHMDALGQAELVRSGEASPLELVDAAIDRIERVNPKINAVITTLFDEARQAAQGDLPAGPFRGVPFLIKDLLASYAGAPMHMGSEFVRGYVPDQDSELTTRYKRAGLICVGKTNVPEFGLPPTTEPAAFGPSRNPWNPDHITGGSSGGSAAAVAAGMTPMAHGNDGGGSIRIPASCCGLFGLKPTRGRITLGPAIGDMMGGLVCEHAITRSVRDSAALLDATAGPMPGDPYYAEPPARPYLEEVGADPGKLRIAFTTSSLNAGIELHPDCVAAVKDAADLCAYLGHEVEEAAPPLDGDTISQPFISIWMASVAWTIDGLSMQLGKEATPDKFEPMTWAMYEMGKAVPVSQYLLSWSLLQQFSRALAHWMADYDVMLTPTLAEPPLKLGELASPPDNPLAGLFRAGQFVPYTPVCNFTGQPAMSTPLYWNDAGLPVGTHFVGRYGDEATLFRLAAQLEAARPWADKRPPIHA